MADMDIFNQDAFTMGQMIGTAEKVPYKPSLLGELNIFSPKPVRTNFATIEERDGVLNLIPTSPRGAPMPQGVVNKRRLRRVDTVRVAKQDFVRAEEVAGIRAWGSETELMQVAQLIVDKQTKLRDDMELTMEYHRMGAILGKVIDVDGSTIHDWFAEYNISAPTAIQFKLDTANTDVKKIIMSQVVRPMQRAAKNAWIIGRTYPVALCGDSFYDKFVNHQAVKETYLNWLSAQDLRQAYGASNANVKGAFAAFKFGGVLWINYRSSDVFDDNATNGLASLGIPSTQAKFFPMDADEIFQVVYSPGEGMNDVNTPGKPVYFELELEKRANPRWAELDMAAYPLHICARPETLFTAVENT